MSPNVNALVHAAIESLAAGLRDCRASEKAREAGHLDVSAALVRDAADRAAEAAALLEARTEVLPCEPALFRLSPSVGKDGGIVWAEWEPPSGYESTVAEVIEGEASRRIDALHAA